MHKEADGTWHADLDPAADLPLTPEPQAATTAPVPPAADASFAGVAMPAGMQPPPPPPVPVRRSRFGGRRRGLAALGVGVLVLGAKILLFSGAVRVISIASTPTYHEPAAVEGESKSTDASLLAAVNQLESGIQLPSLQGGHIEGAGYADSQGRVDYLFVLAQDNAGNDAPRPGVDVTAMFGGQPGVTLSTISSSTFNGVNLNCATATFTSDPASPPFNVCSWYNADAAGVFVDDRSATLTATVQLATSLLTVMTS
jgi:hypothetical protein